MMEVTNYLQLLQAIRARIAELGLSYETVDALAGWADDYASKILTLEIKPQREGGKRRALRAMGPMAFDAMLGAVGLKIILIEDERAIERIRKHRDFVKRKSPVRNVVRQNYIVHRLTHENMRQLGIRSGEMRLIKIPPAKRKKLARKAARAKWKKVKATKVYVEHPA